MVMVRRTDYNQTHFVRNETFKKAADKIQGPTRKIFVEFLERSCTAEFSGFLLYKELGRRLKKTNPVGAVPYLQSFAVSPLHWPLRMRLFHHAASPSLDRGYWEEYEVDFQVLFFIWEAIAAPSWDWGPHGTVHKRQSYFNLHAFCRA